MNIGRREAIIGVGAIAALGITAYFTRGRLLGYVFEDVWDAGTAREIETLHPAIRELVRQYIVSMQLQGINLRIPPGGGLRAFDQQAALYAQGRTAPGNIVTNAAPGQSYHNYGLAFDVVEIDSFGRALWDNPRWEEIREAARGFGFSTIGMWDAGHIEERKYGTWQTLLAEYNAGLTGPDGYILLAA